MGSSSISRAGTLTRRSAVAVAGIALTSFAMAETLPDGMTSSDIDSLAQVLYDLFPHPRLDRGIYRQAALTSLAANGSRERVAALKDGLAKLNADGQQWIGLPDDARIKRLSALAATPFFADMRMTAIFALYHDPAVVAQFGYQGPSLDEGGYLERGFNDLTWLPDPSTATGKP